jgi:acyl carrier protein
VIRTISAHFGSIDRENFRALPTPLMACYGYATVQADRKSRLPTGSSFMDENHDVVREIRHLLRSGLPPDKEIHAETAIMRDLHLDSLAVMDMIMALEDRFDIVIGMERIADVRTVGDLAALVAELRRAG